MPCAHELILQHGSLAARTYRRGCVDVYIYTVTVHVYILIPVRTLTVQVTRTK